MIYQNIVIPYKVLHKDKYYNKISKINIIKKIKKIKNLNLHLNLHLNCIVRDKVMKILKLMLFA